jgi:hypothetical protein
VRRFVGVAAASIQLARTSPCWVESGLTPWPLVVRSLPVPRKQAGTSFRPSVLKWRLKRQSTQKSR